MPPRKALGQSRRLHAAGVALTRRFRKTLSFDAPSEHLAALYGAAAFHSDWSRRNGASQAEVAVEDQPDGTRQLTIREVHRTRWRSKDEHVTVHLSWNCTSGRGRWRHVAEEFRDRSRAEGSVRVVPAGAGCRLEIEGEVSVKVPLVGGRLERRICAYLEADRPGERAFVQARLDAFASEPQPPPASRPTAES